jgi:transcriptional regulator with XRE-family HTH domain
MSTNRTLLEQVRRARIDRGLTQEQAAAEIGLTQPNYSNLERFRRNPAPATITKLTNWLGVQSSPVEPLSSPAEDSLEPEHNEVARASRVGQMRAFDEQSLRFRSQLGSIREYHRISRHQPRVKTAFRIITDATFWVPTNIVPDDDNDYERYPEYKERDEVLTRLISAQIKTFKHEYLPFRDALKSHLWFAMACGYAVAEKIWESVGGQWRLTGLKVKYPWDFDPEIDEWGNLVGLFHIPSATVLNPERFYYAPWPWLHGENYLGISEIEAIRQEIELLNINKKAATDIAHKVSVFPIVHERANPDFDTIVDQMGAGDILHLPAEIVRKSDGSKELLTTQRINPFPDRTSQNGLNQLTDRIDSDGKDISRTLGVPDQLGLTDLDSGSYALSKTVFNLFSARPENAQIWVSNAVNSQIIRDIVRFNHPDWLEDPEYFVPRFRFELLDEDYASAQSARVAEMLKAGIIDADEARNLLGLPARQAADTTEATD